MGTGITVTQSTSSGSGSWDSFETSGAENTERGGYDDDIFTYNITLEAGQDITINGNVDAAAAPVDANGFSALTTPTLGMLSFDDNTGVFAYTITRAELDANGGNQMLSFQVQGLGNDGADFSGGGTGQGVLDTDTIQFNITCFAAGTRIATPDGEVDVETLKRGDLIRTADGRDVPVMWIGTQKVSTLFTPAERLMPVRFAAGSLGHGLPHSDLTVTADHAMLVDGLLCNAGALINGTNIVRIPLGQMGTAYDIFHIETEAHEIILANGAPAETFIDNISRRVFDNFAEYIALYGDEREMQELPLPRAQSARQVPAPTRNRLAGQRAA